MKISIALIFGILLVGCGVLLFVPITEGQKEFKDEPTVVSHGHTTAEESAYSKEYAKLYASMATERLTDLSAADRKAHIQKGLLIGRGSTIDLGTDPPIAQEFLRTVTCVADAIVLGTAITKTAHLTENEMFVYSQYSFRIKQVFKDNAKSPIDVDTQIQITRPGGKVKVGAQVIPVEDGNFEPLKAGKEYLLFLRYIPAATGYMIAAADGDMVIENDHIDSLSNPDLRNYLGVNLPTKTFFADLSLAVARGCVSTSGGK
jgi:hypothetical protein